LQSDFLAAGEFEPLFVDAQAVLFGDGIGQSLGAGAERPQAMKLIFGETAFKLFGFQRKAGFDTDCPAGKDECREQGGKQYSNHAGSSRFDEVLIAPSIANRLEILA
jgi:hypothetical protein